MGSSETSTVYFYVLLYVCPRWFNGTVTQGTYSTEKTGKMAQKISCQGKHRELGNFVKTQGFYFAQVVKALILKVKDFAIFAATKFPEAG